MDFRQGSLRAFKKSGLHRLMYRLPLYRTQRGVQQRCPHGAPPDSSGGERTAAGATMVSSTERLDASYQFRWESRSLEVAKLR